MPQRLAEFLDASAETVAPRLIGAQFVFAGVGGVIVETEAYRPDDPASHSFSGPTPRNRVMFSGPGHVYVYRSYGVHWCANIVCAGASAVLLRALQPTEGLAAMQARRGLSDLAALCSGPGKLCAALCITGTENGARIDAPPFVLRLPETPPPVLSGPRIGISKAVDQPWRFGLSGSPFLSKPFAKPQRLDMVRARTPRE